MTTIKILGVEFELKENSGGSWDLVDRKDKAVVMNIWYSHSDGQFVANYPNARLFYVSQQAEKKVRRITDKLYKEKLTELKFSKHKWIRKDALETMKNVFGNRFHNQ